MSSLHTDDLAASLSAQFDDGAWVLEQNRQARQQAGRLGLEARDLILTFRAHRFRPIVGADDLADERERIRCGRHAFALFGTPKTFVGLSRGATCDGCGRQIVGGEMEYELVADGHEIRLESECYLLFVDELATLQPRSDGAN